MDTYVILLPGDESYWDTTTQEQRNEAYAQHEKFSKALVERGHVITGGAELRHSRETRTLRHDGDGIVVTDGPYAETVEQLTGFYLVQTDDLDDLTEVAQMLMGTEGAIEIRRTVADTDPERAG